MQYQIALLWLSAPELHYNCKFFEGRGEVEEAIASYLKVIELKPDFVEVYFVLVMLKEEGRLKRRFQLQESNSVEA